MGHSIQSYTGSRHPEPYRTTGEFAGGSFGCASYLAQHKETLNADLSSKTLKMALSRLTSSRLNIPEPEQPASTKLIGSGKAKLVYSGYRNALSLSPIEDVVYLVSRKSFGHSDELHEELKVGKNIQRGVYLANLSLFLEVLCHDKVQAKRAAKHLIVKFPNVEELIRGLYTRDPALMEMLPQNSLCFGDAYNRALDRLTETCMYLAIDFINAPGVLIDGKPAVLAKKALTDLENAIRKNPYSFPQSARLAKQLMKGFRDLHAGGFVHGDLKLENVLLYSLNGKPLIKISDWGKCKHLNSKQIGFHCGNRRHMAPERLSSQKGETFGIAMMTIRLLEEEFLSEAPKGMLVAADPKDAHKEKILRDEHDLIKCRKGIERYLSICQGCPERDTKAIDVIPHAIGSFGSLMVTCPNNIDRQVAKYLDALQESLEKKYGASAEKKAGIRELISLLHAMMCSNRNERISMEEASPRLEQILAPFLGPE